MCKRTKHLSIQDRMIVGFSGFRQRILQGEGTNSGGLS